jgi:L-fucose isomerase-like protein
MMKNIPSIKLGIVAVSRDCFPIQLSQKRRKKVLEACKSKKVEIVEVETTIETENDSAKALKEISEKNINALVIYLGNFGPEGPHTRLAQNFDGPIMYAAAAEESIDILANDRGDAYCGMLNASYNIGLRNLPVYIPEYPVGTPEEVADMIADFLPIARAYVGAKGLKIFSFGPRPHDFLACNAPIRPLYDLGVEIMENSELDLYDIYKSAEGNPRIKEVAKEMEKELGKGNQYPDMLNKMAQYEVALVDFYEKNLGMSKYGIFANKCWPSFEKYFTFVPCYVNSRLATRGIPVACEVDIYGALSEYLITCVSQMPATLLDINNTVPYEMYKKAKVTGYKPNDLFMGFHCGNTSSEVMENCELKYQKIMHRLMEPGKDPNITRGTLEGQIRAGEITLYRMQSTAEGTLKCYIAEGEILDINPESFGSIAVFAIKEMGRFYRHVLVEHRFPHHAGICFKHNGKHLYAVTKMLGVNNVFHNKVAGDLYNSENPFVK